MSIPGGGPTHCLSFDVEEHFQVSAFWSEARRQQWGQLESRVQRNIETILALLAKRDVRATFFVLGWVAERYPELVHSIAAQGHEVACHGYGHELITNQNPRTFREDVRKAKEILEDISGKRVYGYRAPSFSITKQTKWAIPILIEEGYLYDSSIFPVLHDRYGMPDATPTIHLLHAEAGCLWEVPPSTVNVLGIRVPAGGGGYFRLYPYPVLRMLLKRIERAGHPLVMYLHPWELDPDQPRMEGSRLSKFRHYLNLYKTEERLCSLLGDFQFDTIQQVLEPIAGVFSPSDRAIPVREASLVVTKPAILASYPPHA
jgi:polysaccharide deacetylase family protein (PEP-CTERM system associated)